MRPDELPFVLPNIPAPYADETLYSWASRVHLWNTNSDVRLTSKQLFGHSSAALLHDFPAHLKHLNQTTQNALGTTREIALNRSLLGYYLSFTSSSLSEDILNRVCVGSYPQLKYKLGIPASRIGGSHPLKFCDACMKEDIKEKGGAYWRISHQYPSSFICNKHMQPLQVVKPQSTPVHLRRWLTPGDPDFPMDTIEYTKEQIQILKRLADHSSAAAQSKPGSYLTDTLSRIYRLELDKANLLTNGGNLRVTKLHTLVNERFNSLRNISPFDRLFLSLDASTGGFVTAITREHSKPAHPFKHLLIIDLLFESWSVFVEKYTHLQLSHVPKTEPKIESISPDVSPILEQFIQLIKEKNLTISDASREVGICTTTGTQWARANDIDFKSRAKTLKPDLLKKVKAKVLKGLMKKDIVSSTGISLVSLNRLLAADATLLDKWKTARFEIQRKEYRKKFLKTVADNPGLPVKALRKKPGNGYQWLYRHDKDWLQDNLPSLWKPYLHR